MLTHALLLGIGLGAIGIATYYWRRANSLYALLVEGANRYEELRQRNHKLEATVAKVDEHLTRDKQSMRRLEAGIDEARHRAQEYETKFTAKQRELSVVSEKLELQKKYLEQELAKAQAKLQKIDPSAEGKQSLEISRLQKENAKLLEKLAAVDKKELRRIKRKITQYDRLYRSMRGLKEITEERNANLETALRKLATWTLKVNGADKDQEIPQEMGPLVGEALQSIGAALIEDAEVFQDLDPRPGASTEASEQAKSEPTESPTQNRAEKEEQSAATLLKEIDSGDDSTARD